MLFFTKDKNEERSILIDVGNGSITGSVVSFKDNQKPLFLYIVRNFFSANEKLESQKLEIEMKDLLNQTLDNINKKGLGKIDKVLISFSSPWFLSKTRFVKISNSKEFIVTKNFLEDVLNKEIEVFKKELEKEYNGEQFEAIEKSVIHSKINGYALDNTLNKRTKILDLSVYVSVVHNLFLKNLLEIIHKHTHLSRNKIHINSFPLVSFTVFRDLFTHEPDFLIMDITSEITDITLVRENSVEKTVSIPSGKNFIIRQISKNLGIPFEIAESTLKLFIDKKLDEQASSKVSEILIQVEKEWSIYLENALLELSDSHLPMTLFLTSDHNIFSIYEEFLKIQKTDSTAIFRKNLKIERIDLEKLQSFYENKSGFNLDEFIVILTLFYKKIFTQK